MKTLILGAHAVSDHADGPAWARIELTEGFLQRVEQLSALCVEHSLRSVTTGDRPAEWDLEDELRLSYDRLEVHGESIWFSCSPKHGSYKCETRGIDLAQLMALFKGGPEDDFIFEGDFIFADEDVKELYEEHLATLSQEPADE